jgi:hypothetical protein
MVPSAAAADARAGTAVGPERSLRIQIPKGLRSLSIWLCPRVSIGSSAEGSLMTIPAEWPLCARPTARSAAERIEGAETGWADATGNIRLMAITDHRIMPVATITRV